LEERLNYLRERKNAVLHTPIPVRAQGKRDAALEAAILTADSKGRLEDIYLPFRPKRITNPGFRSGFKIAVVDADRQVVVTTTIYPPGRRGAGDEALATLASWRAPSRRLIAIGNGTALREPTSSRWICEAAPDLKMSKVVCRKSPPRSIRRPPLLRGIANSTHITQSVSIARGCRIAMWAR